MIKYIEQSTASARQRLEKAGTFQWFHWLVIALSLGLTFVAWYYATVQQAAKTQLQFDRESDQAVSLVVDRLTKCEQALWAGAAFVTSCDSEVNHNKWDDYATKLELDQRFPEVNGMGLITRFEKQKLESFVNSQRQDRAGFHIFPPHDQDECWPIVAITPVDKNSKAIGLDIAHEVNRITAARKARDTGTAQVTGPIVLVQDSAQTPGFLFFVPYYGKPSASDKTTPAKDFQGIVYAPFVVRELMAGVLDKDRRRVGIRISDASETLFDEHVTSEPDFDPDPLLRKTTSVELYGRTWTFDIWTTQSFRQSIDRSRSTSILVAGILIDVMLIGLFYLVSVRARQALGLADTMTDELARFSLAASVNQIGIFDFDVASRRFKWNDAMFRLFQQSPKSFAPDFDSMLDCVHPEDRSALKDSLQHSIRNGEIFDAQYRITTPGGEIRHLLARAVVISDREGRATRLLGANTDITSKQAAAQKLSQTLQMQAAIQDAAGVSMVSTDFDGTILSMNKTAEKMLGYTQDELVLKATPVVLHDAAELQKRADELAHELSRPVTAGFQAIIAMCVDGKTAQREWTYVRKDGTRFPALVTLTALHDDNGNVSGYLAVAADISAQKESHLALQKSNEQLERSNSELAQFAYVASHDLQEPLRKVISFCELLEEDCIDQIDEDGRRYMGYISDGARRMRQLIQALLSYSRIQEEYSRAECVDMNDIVRIAVDDLSAPIDESDAVVTVGRLPVVMGDPTQMVQLMQNLIGNAIKYRDQAAPTVHIDAQRSGEDWLFHVDDNGIGIEPEFREQVFGIFKRLHSRTAYQGTGIGLSICQRIVERSNGKIWIEDSPTGGTRFRFTIPVSNLTVDHEADERTPNQEAVSIGG
ncbi:Phytochrome-like protein cph1 [Rubripirellula tenax]|uniref:histidine kinase n=1 Tax=Rubripirellula tenax TaxID=2528015 RepID=A0A5C6EG85_9BACT|nr:CHASE domain-containing protein [Rubripirellula tenax]TWU46239.1 Phytochrome-like protein cph1 [Rubripirellula tenax]